MSREETGLIAGASPCIHTGEIMKLVYHNKEEALAYLNRQLSEAGTTALEALKERDKKVDELREEYFKQLNKSWKVRFSQKYFGKPVQVDSLTEPTERYIHTTCYIDKWADLYHVQKEWERLLDKCAELMKLIDKVKESKADSFILD